MSRVSPLSTQQIPPLKGKIHYATVRWEGYATTRGGYAIANQHIFGWGGGSGVTWQDIARDDIEAGLRSTNLWRVVGIFFLFLLVFGKFASRESILTGGALLETNARTFAFFLTFLFVPIVGLLVSYTALHRAGEGDDATEESRRDVFLGTVAGRAGILGVAIFVTFLPTFVLLLIESGLTSVYEIFATFVAAVLFGLLFVAVGIAISSLAKSTAQAAAGAVVAFLVLYAWPFLIEAIGISVPQAVLESFWPIFIFADIVETLFSIRQGDLLTSSLLGVLILAVLVAAPLAIGYYRFELPTASETAE